VEEVYDGRSIVRKIQGGDAAKGVASIFFNFSSSLYIIF